MILITALTFGLALVVLGRLAWGHRNAAYPLLVIGALLGLAVASVIWQIAVDQIVTTTIDTERDAREKAVARLEAQLDQARTNPPKPDPAIGQITEQLKKLDDRITTIEHARPPVLPPEPVVTLESAQIKMVQARPRSPQVLGYAGSLAGAKARIVAADIDYCPPPPDSSACVRAPETTDCDHNFICNRQGGSFETFPPGFLARGHPFCVRMKFSLDDGTSGVVAGGPLEPQVGSGWQRDARAPSVCETAYHPAGPS